MKPVERPKRKRDEYPPSLLMVGGSHDGEYWSDAPQAVLRLRKRAFAVATLPKEAKAGEVAEEIYRLRHFRADDQIIVLYGVEGMSDFDIQIALIRGYRRP
jgi:hypothetical protein